MDKEEAVNVMSQVMPEKDAYIVFDIVKKTIEIMNLEPLISDEEFAKLTKEEQLQEYYTPRMCSFKFSDEVSCIFFRFIGDETPLANVLFFPIEATWSFLDTARGYYNTPDTTLSTDEIEKFSFNKAVDMLCLMLRNIHPRIFKTMQSITEETINEWYRQENENYREWESRQGNYVPSVENNVKRVRSNIINEYANEVKTVWDSEKRRIENYQKFRLAEEYEKLIKHWETISLLYRNRKDYLGYAKMPNFEDTPDDLLEELQGSHHRGISLKALEHAARRVRLINLECQDEEILKKKKRRI
jgi:hypothetical protein